MNSIHPLASRLIPFIAVAALPLAAQGVSGQLNGTVLTKAGKPVVEAKVVIRNAETGLLRTGRTDASGRFSAPFLPVGPYTLTIEKEGFQTSTNIRTNLNLGETVPVTVWMVPVAAVTVEVTANTVGVIDTERTSTATLLTTENLASLPVSGRRWESYAFLAPQVTTSSQRGDIAIAGQRGINTAINVDGGNYSSSFFGGTLGNQAEGTPFTLSAEAIREFQVITDGASTEFGRMGGGYVNAITKTGTNDFTGSIFYYEKPKSTVAKSHFNGQEVSEFTNRQYGATVGGPIIKDKLFYFVSVDLQRDARPNPVIYGVGPLNPATFDPTNKADQTFLARSAGYTAHKDANTLLARVDWNVTPEHLVSLRVNRSSFSGDYSTGFNVAYENTGSEEGKTVSIVGQWNWTIGSNWLNEVSINSLSEDLPRGLRASKPQIQVNQVGRFGAGWYERAYEAKQTQISEKITYYTGNLTLRAGFDVNKHNIFETFMAKAQGSYFFKSLADYRLGNWEDYTQWFSLRPGVSAAQAGTMDVSEKEYSAFLWAEWKPNAQWRLAGGFRYDRQEHPQDGILDYSGGVASLGRPGPLTSKMPSDSAISPRASFTWTPDFDKGSTVVRGSAGMFVSRTPSVFIYPVLTSNGIVSGEIIFKSSALTPAMKAAFPDFVRGAAFNYDNPFTFTSYNPATFPAGNPPAVNTFSPDFKNTRTNRMSLSVEKALPNGLVVEAKGTYSRSWNLERVTDLNLTSTGTTSSFGRPLYSTTRPNKNYNSFWVFMSDAEAKYQALTLSAKYLKPESPLQFQLAYTYARERDTDSNERSYTSTNAQDVNRLGDEWGYSANDRRHVVTGFVSYHERRFTGLLFGFNVRYQSGVPYNVQFSSDLNGDSYRNDRVWGSERNAYRECGKTNVDLKISRDWKLFGKTKLSASAEIFNLFNKTARYDRVRLDSKSTEAAPIYATSLYTVSTERQAQFGVRLSF